ncbi:MAG: aldo/keto reductase family protein [Candidatus Hodarchaeales archaeon]|jgi:voltage-dependent potassium channel beta subunit
MKYRNVGGTGLKISEISLGAWLTYGGTVNDEGTQACVTKAIDLGVNFIDLADVYARGKAEESLNKVIQNYDRKDLVISSKVFWPMSDGINDRGLSRKHIMESIEGTLTRLGTDYLDIYFAHRFDYYTPLEETIRAMSNLVDQGLIHYWGTSVWPAVQLERAVWMAKDMGLHPPVVEQPRYNMLDRFIERDVMETCKRNGMGIVVWSPLAQGVLTGKYNEGVPPGSRATTSNFIKHDLIEENFAKVRKLDEIAKTIDVSVSQLALAWVLRRDEISCAITGATSEEHVITNIAASGIDLSTQTLEEIEEILANKPRTHPVYNPISWQN